MQIDARQSVLVVVDVQEKLAPAIHDTERTVANNGRLLQGTARLGIPVVLTEQYVRGIGPTLPALREAAVNPMVIEKIHFSATRQPEFLDALATLGRPQIILTGMETHVCVLQTALGLLAAGYQVFLVADACGSRTPENKALAQERLRQAGAVIVSTEMVLFEWLEQAGTDTFRTLLPLIK